MHFSLNKQRHNRIYSSLPTPASHTSCERCDNYLLFIHFYPLSTLLNQYKRDGILHKMDPQSDWTQYFLWSTPRTVHFCWSLKCKLFTCKLLAENDVWLTLTNKRGQGLGKHLTIALKTALISQELSQWSKFCYFGHYLQHVLTHYLQKILLDLSLGSFPGAITCSSHLQSVPFGPECSHQERNMQALLFFS